MVKPVLPILPIRHLHIQPTDGNGITEWLPTVFYGILLYVAFMFIAGVILRQSKKEAKRHSIKIMLLLCAAAGLIFILRFGITVAAIKGLILCLILFFASISDLSTHEVPDFISVMLLILSFVGIETSEILSMSAGALAVMIPQVLICIVYPERCIGGADIKISSALAFLLGAENGVFALLVGLLSGIITMLFVRKIRKETTDEPFALVPFLSFGALLSFIIG